MHDNRVSNWDLHARSAEEWSGPNKFDAVVERPMRTWCATVAAPNIEPR
jgi:hypothetical protein